MSQTYIKMSQSFKSRRATIYIIVCHTTHVFCNQLINYLLTGYPVRTEKYEALSHVAWTSLRSVRTM